MCHHNSGKIIAEDFTDSKDQLKIISRHDIRTYISNQIQVQKIQNSSKKTINDLMHHFNILAKDRNKIKGMLTYSLKKNKSKLKNHVEKFNYKVENIGGDFLSADYTQIPRAAIRAFIYECVYINFKICNIGRLNVNIVMDHFNMQKKDWNKVKKMILFIIKRDNDKLPPILYEPHVHDNNGNSQNNKQTERMENEHLVQ